MESRIIRGIWEEVAPLHAAHLKGQRVEIRIMDSGNATTALDSVKFEASMLRIAELTKGAARISSEPLRAEDFYESAD